MKKVALVFLAIQISIILLLSACGKKKTEENQAATPKVSSQTSDILSKLPDNTLAFLDIDIDSPGFQKLLNSPYNNANKAIEALQGMSKKGKDSVRDQKDLAADLLETFIGKDGTSPLNINQQGKKNISKYLAFVSGTDVQDIVASFYAEAANDSHFPSNKAQIMADLEKLKLTPTASFTKSPDAEFHMSYDIPNTGSQIHLMIEGKFLAISTSSNVASRLFQDIPAEQIFNQDKVYAANLTQGMQSTDVYKAFVNIERFVQLITKKTIPNPKYQALLNLIPRQLLLNANYQGNYESVANLYLPEKSFPEKLQGLFAAPASSPWKSFSANTVGALSLNLSFLKKILNFVKSDFLTPDDHQTLAKINQVDRFFSEEGTISLAVVNPNITGFPELQMTFPVVNAAEVIELLKTLSASQLGKGGGMPSLPWEKTTIAGQKVEYMVTPFSVGVYLVALPDKLLIGSSENAIKEYLEPTSSLLDSVPAEAKFNDLSVLYSFYLDYAKLYRLAQSFRSMMGMFLPQSQGNETQDFFKKLEEIKNLGTMLVDTSYSNDILQMRMNVVPMAPAATPAQ